MLYRDAISYIADAPTQPRGALRSQPPPPPHLPAPTEARDAPAQLL